MTTNKSSLFTNKTVNNTTEMLSIDIPDEYAYVFLTAGFLPAATNFILGFYFVAKARKQFDVKYPNLYAVPGYHNNADEFNRVQRGHQHMLEFLGDFQICSLIGGLQHPIMVAVAGLIWNIGAVLYMLGYKDTSLDAKTARLRKGGVFQTLANFFIVGVALKCTVTLLK